MNKGEYKLSEETKQKMMKPKSKESALKAIATKRQNGFYDSFGGWKWSQESKNNACKVQKEMRKLYPTTEEQKLKISLTNKEKGIKPPIILCSCVLCKRDIRINNLSKHYNYCKG